MLKVVLWVYGQVFYLLVVEVVVCIFIQDLWMSVEVVKVCLSVLGFYDEDVGFCYIEVFISGIS